MAPGTMLLSVIVVVAYLILAQRVLDRMKLRDWQAGALLVLALLGTFVEIPLVRGVYNISFNLGALIPLFLASYVLITAEPPDRLRGIVASVSTLVITFLIIKYVFRLLGRLQEPGIDSLLLSGAVAGIVAYLLGRSRRGAFVGATLGVFGLGILNLVVIAATGLRTPVTLGGAGLFGTITVASIVAILLAEVIGETRERVAPD